MARDEEKRINLLRRAENIRTELADQIGKINEALVLYREVKKDPQTSDDALSLRQLDKDLERQFTQVFKLSTDLERNITILNLEDPLSEKKFDSEELFEGKHTIYDKCNNNITQIDHEEKSMLIITDDLCDKMSTRINSSPTLDSESEEEDTDSPSMKR